MSRVPPVATAVVALAIAAMIALGVWQLRRADGKATRIALYQANLTQPAIGFPAFGPVPDAALFRPARLTCVRVTAWRTEAGRSAAGRSGWRHIADCVTDADGARALVDVGVDDRLIAPRWAGGPVQGRITTEPQHQPLLARLFVAGAPLRPMLVAERAAPGLTPSAPPDPAAVPNNHLSYAGQWFLFAAVAAVIYALALRRRLRPSQPERR